MHDATSRTTRTNLDGSPVGAVAHPNIALIKYWGKRDEQLVLPYSDSLSMTLDIYPTTTFVRPNGGRCDQVILNDAPATGETVARIRRFLDLVRARAGRTEYLTVDTRNTVPTGAGLASSASGFAALTVAAARLYGLDLDSVALSALARRGSGSASRSMFDGYSIWHAGRGNGEEGDRSSYAERINGDALHLALVVAVVETAAKKIPSRDAMRRTVQTSPLYRAWVESSAKDLHTMRAAISRGDVETVGEIAEGNALGVHATMLAARPAVRYISQASLTILDCVAELRESGVGAYATMDAGPNVKIICRHSAADSIAAAIELLGVTRSVLVARPGPGARLLDDEQ
ncbi:diphosphomevalonate decarboxylase [Nocardia sp. NPDC003482]